MIKNPIFRKFSFAIGLLAIAGSALMTRLYKVPDFFGGFVMGLGIALIVLALYRSKV